MQRGELTSQVKFLNETQDILIKSSVSFLLSADRSVKYCLSPLPYYFFIKLFCLLSHCISKWLAEHLTMKTKAVYSVGKREKKFSLTSWWRLWNVLWNSLLFLHHPSSNCLILELQIQPMNSPPKTPIWPYCSLDKILWSFLIIGIKCNYIRFFLRPMLYNPHFISYSDVTCSVECLLTRFSNFTLYALYHSDSL